MARWLLIAMIFMLALTQTSVAAPTTLPTSIDELRPLIGQPLDSNDIKQFLTLFTPGSHHSGYVFAHNYDAGIELTFSSEPLRLTAIHFYKGDSQFHRYLGELPAGLSWDDTRRDVEKKIRALDPSLSVEGNYSRAGIFVEYERLKLRDATNQVKMITLTPAAQSSVEHHTSPRLQIRPTSVDPKTPDATVDVMLDPTDRNTRIRVLRNVLLDESALDYVTAMPDPRDRHFIIGIDTTREGAEKLKAISDKYQGQQIAIVLDGELLAAPTLHGELTRGFVIDLGKSATREEVMSVARRLYKAVDALSDEPSTTQPSR